MSPKQPRPIFFLTDFGLRDPYAGVMKAVALRLSPGSPSIDLTHLIPPQDLVAGAVALEDAAPHLPPGAVVCAVVDPGVGSARRAMILRTGEIDFVAPDNGLLTPFLGDGEALEIISGGPIQPGASATFHGRDVFAPAAALLARGDDPAGFTRPLREPVHLDWPPLRFPAEDQCQLTILAVDHFGNLATNLRRAEGEGLDGIESAELHAGGRVIGPIVSTFADAPENEPLLLWNSAGRLEIAVNGGSAAEALGLAAGDRVLLFLGRG